MKIIYYSLLLFLAGNFFAANSSVADILNHDIKCGTPEVLRLLSSGLAKPAGRPAIGTDKGTTAISSESHFKVHYDTTGYHKPPMTDKDTNGIPDYIDSTLVYLERAWDVMVDELGFEQPKTDNSAGGGDEVDFYIINYGNTASYGSTHPEQGAGDSATSYCVIDNDFSESKYAVKGYEALKVTTAHEFFHTIHFSYKYGLQYQLSWWMEQSAVWMEDRVWDDVNDYLAYLYFFFGGVKDGIEYPVYSKSTSLTESSGMFKYGATVWAMYLAEKFGDDLIRLIWEQLREAQFPGIANFNDAILEASAGKTGLPEALNEFAVWNYFTGERANTDDFYHDGDIFNVEMTSDEFWEYSPAEGSLSLPNLTSRYLELLFVGKWDVHDILSIDISADNEGPSSSSVLFYNDPYDYAVIPIEGGKINITLEKPWNKAVLITSCTGIVSGNYPFTFKTEMTAQKVGVESQSPLAFELLGAYPNPFNPTTTVAFSLPQADHVSVKAYNASGQLVENLFEGNLTAGEKRVLWKPSQRAGGIYFVTVSTSQETKTEKVLLLK